MQTLKCDPLSYSYLHRQTHHNLWKLLASLFTWPYKSHSIKTFHCSIFLENFHLSPPKTLTYSLKPTCRQYTLMILKILYYKKNFKKMILSPFLKTSTTFPYYSVSFHLLLISFKLVFKKNHGSTLEQELGK